MSRLNELKKEYPELNISFFDLLVRLDPTKSYKYLALFCKLFSKKFDLESEYTFAGKEELSKMRLELHSNLISKNISTDGLSESEILTLHRLTDFWNTDFFSTINEFVHFVENNKITNKDVTSYSTMDDLRGAITLAVMKGMDKEMENQIIKEFEDDTWVVVRPLTFQSSAKYGASTRWCTTYHKEKNYFEKYWRQGILVYFINKKTGYKFACFKSLMEKNDVSFWNAEDQRIDFLILDIDDYLYPVIKNILKSEKTNKNLCTDEIQQQVHKECIDPYELKELYAVAAEPEVRGQEVSEVMNDIQTIENIIETIPNMRA